MFPLSWLLAGLYPSFWLLSYFAGVPAFLPVCFLVSLLLLGLPAFLSVCSLVSWLLLGLRAFSVQFSFPFEATSGSVPTSLATCPVFMVLWLPLSCLPVFSLLIGPRAFCDPASHLTRCLFYCGSI
eukprot:g1891.t1